MNNSIFFVSGEASGDIHGANLARAIFKKNNTIKIYAWGGDEMSKAGVQVLKHYRELAFMGFVEVIRNIRKIFQNFDLIKKQILETNPDVVVLIDYPGFNLRLLPWLKSQNKKIVYYIAPQAWAWKENRVKKMATYIDRLAVILPFEEAFFSARGVHTEFVGHPLLQVLDQTTSNQKLNRIALLPGSRKQEIHHILPIMLSVIPNFPDYEFTIAGMSYLGDEFYNQYMHSPNVKVVYDQSTEILSSSHLALVSSGTATLQTALLGVPLIVCYKTSWLNFQLGKRLIKVKFISLVNLIFGREVVRELIQDDLNTNLLVSEMKSLLSSENYQKTTEAFSKIKKILGEKNASESTANIILNYI